MRASFKDLGIVLLAASVGLAALRGCVGAGLDVFGTVHELPSLRAVGVVLRFFFWALLLNGAVQLVRSRPLPAPAAAGVAAVVLVVAGVLVGWRVQTLRQPGGFYTYGFTPPRTVGRFPYEPGMTLRIDIHGEVTHPTIGPDGQRVCGDGRVEPGGPRVALVGDSFVFGKGVPDEGTLCARLVGLLGADAPRLLNLGQMGANARSHADTLAFAYDALGVDAGAIGFLVPDDALPIDVNDAFRVSRHPLFQAVGAALDPEQLLEVLPAVFEQSYADFTQQAILARGFRRAVDVAHTRQKPTLLYVYNSGLDARWYIDRLNREASRSPWVRVVQVGMLTEAEHRIPYDGHPSVAGNAWTAERLAPELRALLAEAP